MCVCVKNIVLPVNLYKSQQSTPPNATSSLYTASRRLGIFWRAHTNFKVTCKSKESKLRLSII